MNYWYERRSSWNLVCNCGGFLSPALALTFPLGYSISCSVQFNARLKSLSFYKDPTLARVAFLAVNQCWLPDNCPSNNREAS